MECSEVCQCGNSKIMDEVGEKGEGTCHHCLGKLRGRDLPNYPDDAKIDEMGEFVEERNKLCTR